MSIAYPHSKHLAAAGILSLMGQATALAFMLRPNPYTTIIFMAGGSMLIIAGIALFAFVTYRDAKAKAESITAKEFAEGENIFEQGDVGDRVYVVKKGEVEVIREDPEHQTMTVVARLKEGEYFGEMAMISAAPRNATVRAVTDVVALSIDRDDFQTLFSSVPAFKESINRVIHQRK